MCKDTHPTCLVNQTNNTPAHRKPFPQSFLTRTKDYQKNSRYPSNSSSHHPETRTSSEDTSLAMCISDSNGSVNLPL